MVPEPNDAPAQVLESAVPFGVDPGIQMGRFTISLHVDTNLTGDYGQVESILVDGVLRQGVQTPCDQSIVERLFPRPYALVRR